ncbi:hypothetical protein [Burkholderia pyrrocinia]|uniref:hypothetical protein n=1 Tax=Burkholderia pyrrocinia TaxID=60550 RepID=UPI000A60D691|nr:hypothetical protein [Burkholderia pyrrocinia]
MVRRADQRGAFESRMIQPMPRICVWNSRRCEALAMKRRWLAVGVALALSACAGEEHTAAFRKKETQLLETRQTALLRCATQSECDRAWNRTRDFIERRSSTRITRFGPDLIETAQSHLAGNVYLWASRAASADGSATIRLKAMCKGMYDSNGGPGWQYDGCAAKILEIQEGFRSLQDPSSAQGTPPR